MITGTFPQLISALSSIVILLGFMALIRYGARLQDWSAEVQRKLVHVATGLYALALPWVFDERWPVFALLCLAAIILLTLRLPELAKAGIGATLHTVDRSSYGDLLLILGIGTVFIHSNNTPILYVLPLAILTLSDAAAALTGVTYGRRFFIVEDGVKSVEGSVAFFFVSFSLSMICLLSLSDIPRMNVIYLAAIFTAFATLVEADSWQGFDNFFLPAGLMVFLQAYLHASGSTLLIFMGVFVTFVVLALILAPYLGLSRHAARVYVIAAGLIISLIGPAYSLIPVLVFIFHSIAHQFNPSKTQYPELDIVVAIALMSFLWLAIGQESGTFNIELYGLTSLTISIGLAGLSGARFGMLGRFGFGGAVMITGILLYLQIYGGLEHANNMDVNLWTLISACLVVLGIVSFSPQLLVWNRALRLTLMALVIPIGSFLFQFYSEVPLQHDSLSAPGRQTNFLS